MGAQHRWRGVTASCTLWLPAMPCPTESPHCSLFLGPLGPRGVTDAMLREDCLQEQLRVKEKSWSLSEPAFHPLLFQLSPRGLPTAPRSNCLQCLLEMGCPSRSTHGQDTESSLLEPPLPHPREGRTVGHGGTQARQLLSCPTQPQHPVTSLGPQSEDRGRLLEHHQGGLVGADPYSPRPPVCLKPFPFLCKLAHGGRWGGRLFPHLHLSLPESGGCSERPRTEGGQPALWTAAILQPSWGKCLGEEFDSLKNEAQRLFMWLNSQGPQGDHPRARAGQGAAPEHPIPTSHRRLPGLLLAGCGIPGWCLPTPLPCTGTCLQSRREITPLLWPRGAQSDWNLSAMPRCSEKQHGAQPGPRAASFTPTTLCRVGDPDVRLCVTPSPSG